MINIIYILPWKTKQEGTEKDETIIIPQIQPLYLIRRGKNKIPLSCELSH